MRRKLLALTIAFISYLLLVSIAHNYIKPAAMDRVQVLNEGWDVSYNDTEYKDVKLSALRGIIGHATNKGDRLVLKHSIDELKDYDSPTLMFEIRFSRWQVLIDDESVAGYIELLNDTKRFVGCDNIYLSLPYTDKTSELKLELAVAEDGAYNYYEAPMLGSYNDILLCVVYTNLFVFMTSAFLIFFGIIFFAIAIAFRSDLPEIDMQIYSSLLFIDLGIWFLTQFKLFDMFINAYGHQTELEYIALYLVVPLMYLVMGSMQNYLRNKLFLFFAITGSALAIGLIVVHFAGIIHINKLLGVYQIDALVLCVFMIVMLIRDSRHKRITPSQIIQLIGQSTLAVSFIFNVIFYYLEVTGVSEQIMLSKKAVPMGAMCMVFSTMVNYHIFIAESLARKKEFDSLTHLAYADGLTGIPNRSRYEKYLGDLEKQGEDYCVISIDLNGLKTVNDRLGHLMGDKYLLEFSQALKKAGEKGFVARIGGDEFVAILHGENLDKAETVIKDLNKELERLNREKPEIVRSAAAGYAYRHETNEAEWNQVYLLADERMYRQKTDMKIAGVHN